MFTGLVHGCETVLARVGPRLVVNQIAGVSDWTIGESVAVNGVCLTVVDFGAGLAFDVSEETFARTALGGLAAGSRVNLERAMRPMDRFGGHIVQGHVDLVGSVLSVSQLGDSWVFRFSVGEGGDKYLIDKGSITVDGVSLTVVAPEDGQFEVAVIPHTFSHTSLGVMVEGSAVNIEFDVLAKYVEKLLGSRI